MCDYFGLLLLLLPLLKLAGQLSDTMSSLVTVMVPFGVAVETPVEDEPLRDPAPMAD